MDADALRLVATSLIGARMAGLGAPEMLIVLGILILLFGAKKLPELASSMGRSIKEFRKATDDDARDAPDTPPADSA